MSQSRVICAMLVDVNHSSPNQALDRLLLFGTDGLPLDPSELMNASFSGNYPAGNLVASFTPDTAGHKFFFVSGVMTTNLTLNAPLNASPGSQVVIKLSQDNAGGHSLTLGAGILTAGGAGLTLTGTPLSTDLLTMVYDGTNWFAAIAGLAFA
jgi:hypothetical protein